MLHFNTTISLRNVAMVCSLLFLTALLRGQTIFQGPANGDWFTESNWSNGLPATGNDATIPGTASVVIGANLTVNFKIENFGSLTNNAALTLRNTLISGGSITNAGSIIVEAGANLTSSGGFTNVGTLTNKGTVNSNSLFTNDATGVVNNEANFQQLAAFTNNGTVSNKGGTFICPQTFTNNKIVENLAGATFTVDFGGTFKNETGSSLTNAGTFRNFGAFTNNTTVTNSGLFTNVGTHTCNGTFNNENNGKFESSATVNLSGRWNNKAGATTQSGFRFIILANGFLDNFGTFQNNDQIDVRADGTLCNQSNAVLNSAFGSTILNAGTIKTQTTSKIVSNGEINNSNYFLNNGIIESNDGAKIINSDTLINNNVIKNVNILNNSGYFENNSTIENMSGAIWTNTGVFLNTVPAVVINGFEIYNKTGGQFTNNGTVKNNIRLFNEGIVFVNNGYLATAGDIINRSGAVFTNTEVIELLEGSLLNEGQFNNTKTVLIRKCSVLSNKGTLNNTGSISSEGVVFQRGTLTGNAIVKVTGLVISSASSEVATGLCKPVFRSGTDLLGQAKVDAPQVVLPTIGLDSCLGVQYFINGQNRATYSCSNIGSTIPGRLKLILRTGDSLTCNTSIEVFDGVAPQIANCPQDVTILTVSDNAPFSWPAVTATDNCTSTVTFSTTNASGSLFPVGLTKVTISAKDASNNVADCVFNVEVLKVAGSGGSCPADDKTAPVFSNCPANITVVTQGAGAVASWSTPSVTDNCFPIYVRLSQKSGTSFPKGTTAVTYTATDSKGNVGTCTFNVTVNGGDACANDNVKPTISNCPPNVFLINNPANNNAVAVWKEPTAFDNCSGATLSVTQPSGSLFPAGSTTTVTYTAKDGSNNTSTCSFTVQVSSVDPCAGDVTGPVFSRCPSDITVTTTGLSGQATWTAPTATDACNGVIINASQQPGSFFPLGENTVTYQASDRKGNTTLCTFKVTVVNTCLSDTVKPVLSACPANISIISNNGQSNVVTWTAPTATDNCSTPVVTSNFAPGSVFPVGTTIVTYTATDQNGNSSTCSFSVKIFKDACAADVTPPTISNCPTNRPPVSATAACGAVVSWAAPTFADNCGTPSVSLTSAPVPNLTSGSCFSVGVTTLTYTATDAKGNKSTCSFTVTVNQNPCLNDAAPPTINNCPTNRPAVNATSSCGAIVNWTEPTFADNCGTPSVSLTSAPTSNLKSGSCFPVGVTTLTYVATDAKGNKSTCSFTVTVNPQVQGGNCNGGLRASYFNNIHLTGTPVLTRTDASIDFDWGTGSPASSVSVDYFSIRWEGQVEAPVTGVYNFTTNTDDGVRLWVNNHLIIDKWLNQAPTDWSGTISLVGGQKYAIKMEYYENAGGAVAKLSWAYPGKSRHIIPSSRLCSTPACTTVFDPNKCYKIVNKASGKVLDVLGARVDNYAPVVQWSYHGSTNQQWQVQASTVAGFIELKARHSGDILACHNNKKGAAVYMWQDIDNEAKRWKIECNTNGTYRIINQYSNKIIEVENKSTTDGAKIVIGDYTGAENEQWLIQEVACGKPNPSLCLNNGDITVERWNNHHDWTFPLRVPTTAPNITVTQGNTQGPWHIGDNYFTRVRGYIRPQVTGGYAFNITGDDNSELYLSTSSSPADIRRIVFIQGWTGETEYHKYPSQSIKDVRLEAGKVYYFELRHKEGGGGDGWRISWCPPGITQWQVIQSQFLARGCNNNYQALTAQESFTFEARAALNHAQLNWVSNGGNRNDYFVVERATVGNDFEPLSHVNANTGNDNLKSYAYTDIAPAEGENHYRIKTVALDGSIKYSNTKTLTFNKLNEVRIFPNPASDYFDIDLKMYEGKAVNIFLYNAMGLLLKVVSVDAAPSSPLHVDLESLTTGSYLIRIQTEGKRDIIKQVQITH